MKAISLWQPYASAIFAGVKTIETRHWKTDYRGPLAIHAAKRWTGAEIQFWREHVEYPNQVENRHAFREIGILRPEDLPLGAILGTVELYGCLSTDEDLEFAKAGHICSPTEIDWGKYSPGRYAWLLRKVVRFERPVPCVGRQGFWEWTP